MPDKKIPFTKNELLQLGLPKVYEGRQLDEIAFPIGGIGTGTISLGGWGQLRDFEIFNRPNKGLMFRYSFFTLYAKQADKEPVTRVLQGPVGGFFTGSGSGVSRDGGAGLPHMKKCKFTGAFPFAKVDFDDPKMPLNVSIEAFNPFIPTNNKDSSIPCAIFLFHINNPTSEKVEATLFANLENKVGHPEVGKGVISFNKGEELNGLVMTTKKHESESPRYGSMTLMTTWNDLTVQTHWYRGGWFDSLHRFWDKVSEEGVLDENREPSEAADNQTDVGSIGLKVSLEPNEKMTLPIIITWHMPVFEKYWGSPNPTWKNYYATVFDDAVDVAEYVGKNLSKLESETRMFKDSLFSSTLPAPVLDAISSQISILKSTTCLRLEDGTFYGFEGCHPGSGCCEGTCTHVWNYAQALPYLFPELERSIRDADYKYNQCPALAEKCKEGHMTFRMPLPLGTHANGGFHAAADGQMGGIMKVYREWQISGNDEWLKELWDNVKLALEYAWKFWDADKDGVMEGVQHNTYDIEFYGPNTMMGSFYLGALRAGEEMARYLGETEKADEYRKVYESGRALMDKNLFNGEWYIQDIDPKAAEKSSHRAQEPDPETGELKYQYGKGCLSDQMIGQWYAHMLDLGYLFEPENVKKTVKSIFDYNWKAELSEHANPQRIYALNDEQGLLLCSWPKGGRPVLPFVYSDEVWCGIEYQVAAHLIYEGFIEQGLAIVKGVRARHDGTRRNPWNEFECGNHYARSMASYSVMLALAGFHFSAPEKKISFAPLIYKDDFACFFSVDSGWGIYKQKLGEKAGFSDKAGFAIQVQYGSIKLDKCTLGFNPEADVELEVKLEGKPIDAKLDSTENGISICFKDTVCISANETLAICLR